MTRTHPITAFKALSPAKVNLFLKIQGKRPDGYHDLLTLFLLTDLCDTLEFTVSDKILLTCAGNESLPCDHNNLIVRAANILLESTGVKKGAEIHLQKKIPTGAGMGGGSSNAATALWALNRLWNLHLSVTKLAELSLKIGSDVPFFLFGAQAAIGQGKGEKLEKIPDFLQKTLIIVDPGMPISTAWAYGAATNLLTEKNRNVNLYGLYASYLEGKAGLSDLLFNDFEEVVFSRYPDIRTIKKRLLDGNAEGAILTGSGSAMVGFFGNNEEALRWQSTNRDLKTFLAHPLRNVGEHFCITSFEEDQGGNHRGSFDASQRR